MVQIHAPIYAHCSVFLNTEIHVHVFRHESSMVSTTLWLLCSFLGTFDITAGTKVKVDLIGSVAFLFFINPRIFETLTFHFL